MHKKNIRGQKTCALTGCIKFNGQILILEEENIHQRINEYIGEPFHDESQQPEIHRNVERPEMVKSEVESALIKLN